MTEKDGLYAINMLFATFVGIGIGVTQPVLGVVLGVAFFLLTSAITKYRYGWLRRLA